jgi:hypothetical protein
MTSLKDVLLAHLLLMCDTHLDAGRQKESEKDWMALQRILMTALDAVEIANGLLVFAVLGAGIQVRELDAELLARCHDLRRHPHVMHQKRRGCDPKNIAEWLCDLHKCHDDVLVLGTSMSLRTGESG